MMIPLECFLRRVLPKEHYEKTIERIIQEKIFKPRKDTEEFILTFPLDWESLDKTEDRNWRMQLQSWNMFNPIMNVFDSYSDKDKLVKYFFEIAHDWYNNYDNDPDDIVAPKMPESYAWYDMSAGCRALVIAFFMNRIDAFKLTVNNEQNQLLSNLALKHIRHLSCPDTTNLHYNHGMFQLHGLMALTQCLGISKYEKEYEYALGNMEKMVISQFDDDGIHKEHSPHYHFFSLNVFKSVISSGWYSKNNIIENRIVKAAQVCKWLVDPLKRIACIGDSILASQNSINFTEGLSDNETSDNYVISDFPNSGYSIIRSRWDSSPLSSTYLFFMAGYHSKVHKHRDCLSFEWFDHGEKILCDSGKYGYNSNKFRGYVLSNKAHNTIEINKFDILRMQPYGSAINKTLQLEQNIFYINASLDYKAFSFIRNLYLNAGKWIILNDKLNHVKARISTQWFHLAIGYVLKNSIKNRLVFRKGNREVIINCLNKGAKVSLFNGDEECMQGFISENDYEIQPANAIGFGTNEKKENIITIIALSKEDELNAMEFIENNLQTSEV